MPTPERFRGALLALATFTVLWAGPAILAAREEPPTTAERPDHRESAREHDEEAPPPQEETPPLPEGMTLEGVLERAGSPPPPDYPDPVPDDAPYLFTFFEQLELRLPDDDTRDRLGWEAQGWYGGALHKFWWKNEGETVTEGPSSAETETDLLYSRLVTPFWSLQAGVQLAQEWEEGASEELWSGVVALQGLAPYKFELDQSLYFSEDGDVILEIEGEYDLRITQRWVFQPRAELGFSAQDVPERSLGSGMTDAALDLRSRYEFKRELASYLGVRYRFLVGETEDLAEAAGEDTGQFEVLAGLRFAF